MSKVVRFEVTTRVADNTDLQKLRQRLADTIRTISNPVREDEGITVVTNVKIIRDEP